MIARRTAAEVEDWSWNTTRRRLGVLWRLTKPYRFRTFLSVFSLLAATATALAPPLLAKYALDDAIDGKTGTKLTVVVALFVFLALANWGMTYVETYMTGWVGERILADLRKQLFGHLQQLSLGFYERNRAGVLISRMTNDVEAIDQLVTDGVTTLAQSTLLLSGTAFLLIFLDCAARPRDADRDPVHDRRDRALPLALGPRLLVGARAARARDGHARRGHLRHADGAGVRARAARDGELPLGRARLPRVEHADGRAERLYFPFVSLLATLALADRARLRRPPLPRRRDRSSRRCSRSCST